MPKTRGPDVVFILGQTATGKTDAALALAAALPHAEIVNCDSRQVYRGMSIGTAKPTVEQRASVPHHVIDVADPRDGFSLATFLGLARSALDEILARGAVPIVVGGTGQYAWGLAEGWEAPSVPPQSALRDRLEREAAERGADALHERLAKRDPDAARLIDPRNVRRVIRALEVIEVTGSRFSSQRKRHTPSFTPRVFGLAVARNELHARIDQRIQRMLALGWLDEVRSLLDDGCSPELPAFSSAGYRDMAAHLRGDVSLAEAVGGTLAETRRLAKSQATWFRRADPRIAWVAGPGELAAALAHDT